MSVSQTGFPLVTNEYSYFWTIDSQEQKLHTELLWLHAKDLVHCSFQQHVQEYFANHLSFCSTSTFPLPSSLQTECQNYVRVLLVNKTEVITCGTNAFQPRCIAREVVTCVSGCAGFVETRWKGRRFNAPPVSLCPAFRWATWAACWRVWTAWPAARTTLATTPRRWWQRAESCTPPPLSISPAVTPSYTGAWAACHHSGLPSTTPNGWMVQNHCTITLTSYLSVIYLTVLHIMSIFITN